MKINTIVYKKLRHAIINHGAAVRDDDNQIILDVRGYTYIIDHCDFPDGDITIYKNGDEDLIFSPDGSVSFLYFDDLGVSMDDLRIIQKKYA